MCLFQKANVVGGDNSTTLFTWFRQISSGGQIKLKLETRSQAKLRFLLNSKIHVHI